MVLACLVWGLALRRCGATAVLVQAGYWIGVFARLAHDYHAPRLGETAGLHPHDADARRYVVCCEAR